MLASWIPHRTSKRRLKHGRTLHLRGGSLQARESAAIYPLLSLPLVPAPDRLRLRGERDDRNRPNTAPHRQPEMISIPSPSGMGQTVARCPTCKIALWSSYTIAGDKIRFVRACTLDDSDALPPQLHIFTEYKQPWMVLPPNTPSVPEFYRTADYWPAESIARWGDARW
jgi:hypothetical protein